MTEKKHEDDGDRKPSARSKIPRSTHKKNTMMMAIACRSLHFRHRSDADWRGALRMLARVSGREAKHPRPADGGLRRTFVPAIGCSVKTANDDGDCKQLSKQKTKKTKSNQF